LADLVLNTKLTKMLLQNLIIQISKHIDSLIQLKFPQS